MVSRRGRLLYIFGQPGAGKSTLVKAITAGCLSHTLSEEGVALVSYDSQPPVVEIGKDRETFRGTDALGMTVITQAVPWIQRAEYELVLAEGDRLAVDRFLQAAAENYDLELVYLATPDEEAARRRTERGSRQAETWIKGRISKHAKLADRWAWTTIRLDGSYPPPILVEYLVERSRVAAAFR